MEIKNIFKNRNRKIENGAKVQNTLSNSEYRYERIKNLIKDADAIIVGAGAGLSTAAGLEYGGERFESNFKEFINKYGMTDMYSAAFYPFKTQEEKWSYWSNHILMNRYEFKENGTYKNLKDLIKDKDYFVLTTNGDHLFYKAGFDSNRIFATQGDYGLLQCAKACHDKLYDNEHIVYEMIEKQKDLKIPSELIPKCPVCGGDMEVNLRKDNYFIQDENWDIEYKNYENFLSKHKEDKVLFIELGVGMNTPVIIKYPFWRMTNSWPNATYICINKGAAYVPNEIKDKSICIDEDIKVVMEEMSEVKKGEE
ncbi:hypothetical protein SH2C18_33370 [Clostridium sediminicola]|uniref:SIR2 family NAD-dependent protein deacylase n=1 Tax=Clostridium sediminicola TaxID=3114879 RepID=UPI0031F1D4B0